jgi:DNA-binding HxlR family transcriptional regulator
MDLYRASFCSRYHRAVEIVGRRWNGAILRAMLTGARRFGEIREAIPDLSNRMLSERLGELEEEGIVERKVVPEKPVRVEYRLTEKGRALGPVVEAISAWAEEWIGSGEEGSSTEEVGGEGDHDATPRAGGF